MPEDGTNQLAARYGVATREHVASEVVAGVSPDAVEPHIACAHQQYKNYVAPGGSLESLSAPEKEISEVFLELSLVLGFMDTDADREKSRNVWFRSYDAKTIEVQIDASNDTVQQVALRYIVSIDSQSHKVTVHHKQEAYNEEGVPMVAQFKKSVLTRDDLSAEGTVQPVTVARILNDICTKSGLPFSHVEQVLRHGKKPALEHDAAQATSALSDELRPI